MKKILCVLSIVLLLYSCGSIKSSLKNVDNTVIGPELNEALGSFKVTKNATSKKYGYDPDYPVNVNFTSVEDGWNNQVRFLNALAGPNGEYISFTFKDVCCPFPTKKTETGAGTIDIFEITWKGQDKPILIYINKFEKGELLIPVGLTARK